MHYLFLCLIAWLEKEKGAKEEVERKNNLYRYVQTSSHLDKTRGIRELKNRKKKKSQSKNEIKTQLLFANLLVLKRKKVSTNLYIFESVSVSLVVRDCNTRLLLLLYSFIR